MNEENIKFVKFHKVNILGTSGVGKKTLFTEFKKYNNPKYSEEDNITNEEENKIVPNIIELPIERITIPLKKENLYLHLNIYITNLDNLEIIKEKNKYLLYNSEIILLIVDITNTNSFHVIKEYLDFILKKENDDIFDSNYQNNEIIVLANKTDLDSDREVGSYELNQLTDDHPKIKLLEISLKDLDNFDELLYQMNTILKQDNFKIHNIIEIKEPIQIPKNLNNNLLNVNSVITIFFLGSSGVGKTSFINRFFSNLYSSNTLSTLGIDVEKSLLKINGNLYRLEVWDTAGQERLRSIPKKYYVKGDAFLLMFDVTDEKSFSDLNQWIKDLSSARNRDNDFSTTCDTVIYLIGNKIDDFDNRKILSKDAEKFSSENNIYYIEVSCKDGINIYEVMINIIIDASKKLEYIRKSIFLTKKNQKKNDNKNCCK